MSLCPRPGGSKLKLAAGKTAQIKLPLYVNRLQDGGKIVVGSAIPLWSLNTATGLWMQEGSGTAVASAASSTGPTLRATISHFSWWNLNPVARRASVNLTFCLARRPKAIRYVVGPEKLLAHCF